MVWKGNFRVEFRDRIVSLGPGECVVVPRGVAHRTCADEEAQILCFEPADTRNTGNLQDAAYTAPGGVRWSADRSRIAMDRRSGTAPTSCPRSCSR